VKKIRRVQLCTPLYFFVSVERKKARIAAGFFLSKQNIIKK